MHIAHCIDMISALIYVFTLGCTKLWLQRQLHALQMAHQQKIGPKNRTLLNYTNMWTPKPKAQERAKEASTQLRYQV